MPISFRMIFIVLGTFFLGIWKSLPYTVMFNGQIENTDPIKPENITGDPLLVYWKTLVIFCRGRTIAQCWCLQEGPFYFCSMDLVMQFASQLMQSDCGGPKNYKPENPENLLKLRNCKYQLGNHIIQQTRCRDSSIQWEPHSTKRRDTKQYSVNILMK